MPKINRVFLMDANVVIAPEGITPICEICSHEFFLPKGAHGISLELETHESGEKTSVEVTGPVCPTCVAKSPAELIEDMEEAANYMDNQAILFRKAAVAMARMKYWLIECDGPPVLPMGA